MTTIFGRLQVAADTNYPLLPGGTTASSAVAALQASLDEAQSRARASVAGGGAAGREAGGATIRPSGARLTRGGSVKL